MSDFATTHGPGSGRVTASVWPTLVLPPDQRPAWLPSPYAYGLHVSGKQAMPTPGNEVLRGKRLEGVALEMLEELGHEVVDRQVTHHHESLPALATIDAVATDSDGAFVGVETKVVDGRDFDRFWNGRPPIYPRLQAQAQMACSGYHKTLVCALVLGWKDLSLEVFDEPRRADMIGVLEQAARDFLERLARDELPDPDDSSSSYAALSKAVDLDEEKAVALNDPEADERAERWRQAQLDRKAAEKIEEACQHYFAARAQDAGTIRLPGGGEIKRKMVNKRACSIAASSYWRWNIG